MRALYQLGIGDDAKDAGQTFTLRIRLNAGAQLQYEEEVEGYVRIQGLCL